MNVEDLLKIVDRAGYRHLCVPRAEDSQNAEAGRHDVRPVRAADAGTGARSPTVLRPHRRSVKASEAQDGENTQKARVGRPRVEDADKTNEARKP